MSVTLHLECDGCFEKTQVRLGHREFESFSGRSWGFGTWKMPTIDEAIEPTGWAWCDPYTGCTYCPVCWEGIEKEDVKE